MLTRMVCAGVLCAASLSAADELGVPSPGWDFTNPVNIAESRDWATLYWASEDAGSPTAEFASFEFTNPIPPDLNPFFPALQLFEAIYSEEINSQSTSNDPYSILDLLRDDPEVLDQFRTYTTTGVLATNLATEFYPALTHANLIVQAIAEDGASVETAWIDPEGNVGSQTLMLGPKPGGSPPLQPPFDDPPVPPGMEDLDQDLRDNVDDSDLDGPDLYVPDNTPTQGQPGFDCDDYAAALAAFLKNRLLATYPDLWIGMFLYWWQDAEGNWHGHAMVIVRSGNYYYIIDPQTGMVRGPYDNTTSPIIPARQVVCSWYGTCVFEEDEWKQWSFDYRVIGEPDFWWTDPELRQHFQDGMGLTPPEVDEYVWNVVGGS